jgi:muconolactone delta-isomerase
VGISTGFGYGSCESVVQYLVEMKLANSSRPTSQQEGKAFIERLIFPTLDRCERLQKEGKVLAGGPLAGAIALFFIVSVESTRELDDLIASLPMWPRMETVVTPLSTFGDRTPRFAIGWRNPPMRNDSSLNV